MGHLLGHGVRLGHTTRERLRRDGGRRGHRNHALAPLHHDDPADGGGALGRASRRPPAPSGAAPSLHRPRSRSCRPHRDGASGRPGARRRHRGAGALIPARAISTTISAASASTVFGRTCARSSRPRISAGLLSPNSGRKREMRPWWPGFRAVPVRKGFPSCGKGPRPRPSEWATDAASGPGPQRRSATIFRRVRQITLITCHGNHAGRFASRNKIAAARRPPLRFGRCRCARRCRPGPPAARGRHEGRDGRGQSDNRRTP